ncbi:MAG: cysteine--tRNA ligase [Chloroflexi bacterium]|nr:cysteine--tRNA ligase [Chloroflexota bacterium]
MGLNELQIFNVLGRQKQRFDPLVDGKVGMYVCGPTVQELSHLGHAKTYVAFDTIARWLRHCGYDLLYIQNITDVGHLLATDEDRILKKAAEMQWRPMQLVEHYTREYFADMDQLGIQRPDISPRASAHIPEQIGMTQELIAAGHAYVANGNVYFDVRSAPAYGKLSNRKWEAEETGSREAIRSEKRHAEDFALWKRADEEHILRWDSPWGEGFPGWHIECSAMARKYLGPTFDIHGGGIDNIYPHNENEIAQSEAANQAPFARYWLLVGSLTVDGVKMSKSLGNFTTIRESLEQHRPEVLRLFTLSAHYRSPVDYSEAALAGAAGGWERLISAWRRAQHRSTSADASAGGDSFQSRIQHARSQFSDAMNDDFNTPQAIAALQQFTREVNTLLQEGTALGSAILGEIVATYDQLAGEVLGLLPGAESSANAARETGLIELLLELRAQARSEKQFARSDYIREQLSRLGIALEDGAAGTTWRIP